MDKVASIFDYARPGLDPTVWGQDGKLLPKNHEQIVELIHSFLTDSGFKHYNEWIESINIVGSITTYQYVSTSDIDVHMFANLDKFIELENPVLDKQAAADLLDAFRKQIDKEKIALDSTRHPIELYFETELSHRTTEGTGVYSIISNEWLKDPIVINKDFDIEESKPKIVEEAAEIASEIDASFGDIKREIHRIEDLQETIGSWSKENRKLFQDKLNKKMESIEAEIDELLKLREKVVEDRRGKNYSPQSEQEIKFKYLQKFGYLALLGDLKDLLEKDQEITEQNIEEIKEIVNTPLGTEASLQMIASEKQLFIDFDNTIAKEKKDHQIGTLIPGAKEAMDSFKKEGWTIVIYSVRANDDEGRQQIKDFLDSNHVPYDEIFVGKPEASFYIDDHGIKFTNWNEVKKQVTKSAQKGVEYDYSSTQFNMPKDISQKIVEWSVENIPNEDLYDDHTKRYGRELESHVTVLYGLETNDAKPIEDALKGEKAFKIKLGKTDFFETKTGDAVIIHVDSPELHELYDKLEKLPHSDLGLDYNPHITIAYVKEGHGKNYAGKKDFDGIEVPVDVLTFSPKEGDQVSIEFKAQKQAAKTKVVPIETMNIGGNTVKIVVAQDALDNYLKSIKYFYTNPNLMEGDDMRSAAHDAALESALQLTDFKGEDPYLFAAQVRDAISRFAEDMFDKKYGSLKIKAEFLPTISTPAPDNIWQDDSDLELPVKPDPISDEDTYYQPPAEKPRKSMWKQILDGLFGDSEKEAALGQKYWITPDGQFIGMRGTHLNWVRENLFKQNLMKYTDSNTLPKYEGAGIDAYTIASRMIEDGWVRLTTDDSQFQFGIEVNDLHDIPASVDIAIDKFFNPNDKRPIILESNERAETVKITDPFPSIQEAVNNSKIEQYNVAASLKLGSFSLNYWLDPNGQEYEGDALKQEGVKPEQLIHGGWVNVTVPSDRQGIILTVDELEFTPDFLNAFLAKTVGYGDPVTVKDMKGSTITLRFPFKNIRGLIKKHLYAPEQERAASLKTAEKNGYWLSPDGKEIKLGPSQEHAKVIKQHGLTFPEAITEHNWVRIRMNGNEAYIEVRDLTHAPESIEDFLIRHPVDQVFMEEPYSRRYVEFRPMDMMESNLQYTINDELKRRRAASLSILSDVTDEILNQVKTTGGVTWNMSKGNLSGQKMFAVSIYLDDSVVLDHEPTPEELKTYMFKKNGLLSKPENSLGIWHDTASGKYYLDIVVTLADRNQAIELGKQHNQKAIFDLSTFQEIPTGGTGEKQAGYYGPEDNRNEKEYFSEETDDQDLGNPNQRFMGRPKGPYRSNEDEVTKMLFDQEDDQSKDASVKVAFTAQGFWLAPDGQAYDVRKSGVITHGNWVEKNKKLLKTKYGFSDDLLKQDYFEIAAQMLQNGWVRVGDLQRRGFGIELADIRRIPSYVEDFMPTVLQDGDHIIVADLNQRSVEVDYPWKSLQAAVRRGLRGLKNNIITAVDYSKEEQEDIYNEQHQYGNDPGGGGGWTPHNYNNSSTDYPAPKDMEPVQVFLDKLEKEKTPPIPSYEVSWYDSLPKE